MESRTTASNPAPYESRLLTELRRSGASLFSRIPLDVTRLIGEYCELDTQSEIGIALQHAADARREHIDALIAMVCAKPHLLLLRGRVITPGGHDVRGVTLYEYCLGAGDPELASKIQPYFAKITGINGKAERTAQYERYKPYIDAMMTQEPYDISPLIDIIKQSPAADVTAMLNNDMTHESILRDAIVQFRNEHAPRIITEPCMHFNYRSLHHALELLDREWSNLYQAGGYDPDKIHLVWRQLIGFEIRRLPGIDRCRLAQGLCYHDWERTYQYKVDVDDVDDVDELPLTMTDDSLDGLGVDFSLDIHYGHPNGSAACMHWWLRSTVVELGNFISSKNSRLTELMQRPEQTTGCVIS